MDLIMRRGVVGGRDVVSAHGEIDLATLPALHQSLLSHTIDEQLTTFIVDLDGVSACDDAGLGVLLGCAGRVRAAGGEMIVICSNGPLRTRLTRTGFDRAVRVESSIGDSTAP